MELYENIIENKPVNESQDYDDFINRRRTNKKSIHTKVTTLKDNGEIHSEIMGTKTDEELVSFNSSNEKEIKNEIVSNIENTTTANDNKVNSPTKQEENKINTDTKINSDIKSKNNEDRTVLGMKPAYGYTFITIISLVGLVAVVKIFKNNKPKLSLN